MQPALPRRQRPLALAHIGSAVARRRSFCIAVTILMGAACTFPRPADINDDGRIAGFTVSATLPPFIRAGASVEMTVTVQRDAGFGRDINIELMNLPSGVTATPVTVGGTDAVGTIELSTRSDSPTGDTSISIVATSGDLVNTQSAILVVAGPPGSLDTSFGTGGAMPVPALLADTRIGSLLDAGQGALILCGASGGDFMVARLTRAGTPDTTFGTGGIARLGADVPIAAARCALHGASIVLAGHVTYPTPEHNYDLVLGRLHADGAADPALGNGAGIAIVQDPSRSVADVRAIAIDTSGRVVVRAESYSVSPDNVVTTGVAVARIRPDGSADPGFGSQGVTVTADRGPDPSLHIRDDGRILVGTWGSQSGYDDVIVLRDDGGIRSRIPLPEGARTGANPREFLLRTDGSLLVIGLAAKVWHVAGDQLDTTFGVNGLVQHAHELLYTTAVRGHGNALVALVGTGALESRSGAVWFDATTGAVDESIGNSGFKDHGPGAHLRGISTPDGRVTVVRGPTLSFDADRNLEIVRFWY